MAETSFRSGSSAGGQSRIDAAFDRLNASLAPGDRISKADFMAAIENNVAAIAADPIGTLSSVAESSQQAYQTDAPNASVYAGADTESGGIMDGWRAINIDLEFSKLAAEIAADRGLIPAQAMPAVQNFIGIIDEAIQNIGSMSSLGMEEAVSTSEFGDPTVGANSLFADPEIQSYEANPQPALNNNTMAVPTIDYNATFGKMPGGVMTANGGLLSGPFVTAPVMDYPQAAVPSGFNAYPETPRSYPDITPNVASAPGGLFSFAGFNEPASAQPAGSFSPSSPFGLGFGAPLSTAKSSGAFNNIAQMAPSGTFNPTSPFGNGLPAASGMPSPDMSNYGQRIAGAFEAPQQSAPGVNPNDVRNSAMTGKQGTSLITTAGRPTPAAPAASPSSLAAAYAAAQYVPAQNEIGQIASGTPMMPSSVDIPGGAATTSAPPSRSVQQATPPAPEVPRTVAPRAPTKTTPPGMVEVAPGKFMPGYITDKPPAGRAAPMVATPNGLMPDVKGNPLQVLRDQIGLFAANPGSLFTAALGALQGGVFFDRLFPDRAVTNVAPQERQSIGWGLSAPSGGGGLGGGNVGGIGGLGGFSSSRGSDGGINSGYTSSSGFTYDR